MTVKIYKPAKTSMQSGFKKTKLWLAEYISEVEKTKTNKLIKGFGIVVFVCAIGITFYTIKENYDGNNITQSISVEKDKPKKIEAKGYIGTESIQTDEYERVIFKNIKEQDAIDLICNEGGVRCAVLEHTIN